MHRQLYELESKLLQGGYIGDYRSIKGVKKEDTRSLDYNMHVMKIACMYHAHGHMNLSDMRGGLVYRNN